MAKAASTTSKKNAAAAAGKKKKQSVAKASGQQPGKKKKKQKIQPSKKKKSKSKSKKKPQPRQPQKQQPVDGIQLHRIDDVAAPCPCWMTTNSIDGTSMMDGLNAEVELVAAHVRLTEQEQAARQEALQALQRLVDRVLSDKPTGQAGTVSSFQCQVFGSYSDSQQVCYWKSDMDVALQRVHSVRDDRADNIPNDERLQQRKRQAKKTLALLERPLHEQSWTSKVEFIRWARVPILKVVTTAQLELDIAVDVGLPTTGAPKGKRFHKKPQRDKQDGTVDITHTASQFANLQLAKYQSFAPVVLLLKVLLAQHGLDMPSIGGLGSFKLYVLVAFHIQQHLELGGTDRPGEVFLTLLFRYGQIDLTKNPLQVHDTMKQLVPYDLGPLAQSDLTTDTILQDGFGNDVHLDNVQRLNQCMYLFRQCWLRLQDVLVERMSFKTGDGDGNYRSLLVHVLDAERLDRERRAGLEAATTTTAKPKNQRKKAPPVASLPRAPAAQETRKRPAVDNNPAKKKGTSYQEAINVDDDSSDDETPSAAVDVDEPKEKTADELIAGYNGGGVEDRSLGEGTEHPPSAKRLRV